MLYHAAGVLPYCAGHVLLGLEARGWSGFAGTALAGEAPCETALREFHKETAQLFAPCEGSPDLDLTTATCIVTTTPKSRVFHLFLQPFTSTGLGPGNILGTGNRLGPCRHVDDAFQFKRHRTSMRTEREKLRLRWVPVDEIAPLHLSPSFRADMPEIVRALRAEAAVTGAHWTGETPAKPVEVDRVLTRARAGSTARD